MLTNNTVGNRITLIWFVGLFLIASSTLVAQEMSTEVLEWNTGERKQNTSRIYELPAKVNQPFVAVTLKLEQGSTTDNPNLFYRTKESGHWSPWKEIQEESHGNKALDLLQFEQLYVSTEVRNIQFKKAGNLTGKIAVELFYPGNTPASTNIATKDLGNAKGGGCNCPQPSIEERLDWCPTGTCPEDATPVATNVTHLIVHHSAGVNSSNDWAAVVRSIWNYHVNTNGWDDVGYNYLIDPNGVIYEGRGADVVGAHFSCMNANTMGICLLGNFETAQPTNEMLDALTTIQGWKICEMGVDALAESYNTLAEMDLYHISGHRDGNASTSSNSCATGTVCPGNNVYQLLPNIRTATADYTTDCLLDTHSDIIVLSMNTSPGAPEVGETVNLEVALKNVGSADVNSPFNVDWQIGGVSVHNESVAALNINQTVNLSTSYTFTAPNSFSYCVYADAASNELNALNNSFCLSVAVSDTITSVGINEEYEIDWEVYPNPAINQIQLRIEVPWESWELINELGQVLTVSQDDVMDVASLPSGLYTVVVKTEQGILYRKLIKQ